MKLTNEQIQILKDCKVEGNKIYLQWQLNRKQYLNINQILETIWVKWSKWKKAHIADWLNQEDIKNAFEDIFKTWEVETLKETVKKFQFYPTPKEVAEYLVELADIQKTDFVLEPSAWEWNIVDEILPKIKDWAKYNNIVLIELDIRKVKQLKEKYDCFWWMKDDCDWLWTYSSEYLMNIYQWDFLENNLNTNTFNKIIMNPPFTKSQDVRHILKAYSHLREWWRIVSIASSSITTRQWKLYDELRALNPKFTELPEWSFKKSWTWVNTVIVLIDK